nr:uncharacterized protein LOC106621417 [Bactrocera oleae]
MYLDRNAKAQAFNKIVQDLEMPSLNVFEVKKKWKTLRSQYLREIREFRTSKKSGSGVDDIPTPKLWCFSHLKFLESYSQVRSGESNCEDPGSLIVIFELNSLRQLNDTPSTHTTSAEVIDITNDSSYRKEAGRKRGKENAFQKLKKDVANFKDRMKEKRNRPFSWLGNLVTTKMEEIIPELQDDAAWEIQCLMRRLVQQSKSASSSRALPSDILQNAMSGVFDESDFVL